jgi:hypothetical protein
MQGVPVGLHQRSYCSPTAGDQQVTTGTDGAFEFQVYLHDTDSFQIRVAAEGYETVEQTFGGFDCLFCACRPLEIVLQPLR